MGAMSGDLREGPASGDQPGRAAGERPAGLDPVPNGGNGQSSLALERARQEAEALASIARDLAGSLRTQDLLQRIVGAAAALTASDLSHVAVSDPDDGLYRVRAVSGARTNLLLGLPQAAPRSLGALALANGRPAWTDNRTADPRLNQGVYGFVAAEGCVSQLVAPVRSGDQCLALLYVSRRDNRPYGQPDADLLSRLAVHAALALGNARLYDDLASANARLAQALRHNELLLNAVGEAVCGLDPQGGITFANPAAARMLGYSIDELLGKRLHGLVHHLRPDGSPYPREECPAVQALSRGEIYEVSGEIYWRKDGSGFPIESISTPFWEAGRIAGSVLTFRDITERQQAELQRQALSRTEKLRVLGQLAGGVAHDLNQSLGLVVGHSELTLRSLDRPGTRPGELRDSLETILQAAVDGAEAVKRLQTFAQVRPEEPAEIVDLRALLDEVVRLTAPRWRDDAQVEGRAIECTVECETDAKIEGWPSSLREALTNLVFNAIDALPRGGSIGLTARREEGAVAVEVADDGVGMSSEIQAQIFEPFFTTKGERGTGLGLPMVFGIVERHGGSVRVQSAPGEGTRLRLSFPSAADFEPAELAEQLQDAAGAMHILVVDDEPGLRRMAARMLELEGHSVELAHSAEQAIELLESTQFNLVLSDHGLGSGMNGLELANVVRKRWPLVRFLLATGWGAAIDSEIARSMGVEAILDKPYRLSRLRRLLVGSEAERK